MLFGTYVKVPTESQLLKASNTLILDIPLFILKGTVAIWAFWFLADKGIRIEYAKGVSEACKEINQYVAGGKLTVKEAAQMAFDMRQQYLVWAREKSSTLGQIFAAAMKPPDLRFDKYLNKYSQLLFQKDFSRVTASEEAKVMTAVLESAGRANPKVSSALVNAGELAKAAVPIAVGLSLLSIAVAPDWEAELAEQISSWSRAIILRSFTVETGRLYSPAGALLGGIVGTIVATILDTNTFPDLIDWFYGGSSRSSASHVLGDAYTPTREAAMKIMKESGRGYHVHRVHNHNLVAIDQDPSRSLATIVWTGSTDISATNPGNPGDLITLIQWVQRNLPSYISGIKVVYGQNAPSDHISEINKGVPDINHNFGGEYVWLVPEWTQDRDKAVTYFEVVITGSSQAGMSDLAKGAGGKYRYLVPQADVHIEKKLKRLALYRKSNSEGPVHESDIKDRGYTDFSTDINAGRGGDYLHLIWEAGY
ncbi:hypothetical protein F5Y01DRAFT_319767 [Xylaria sp. FL0043]|nr:hypothetical protein F5Y01DRAFT_319767 [Xylaria sp. FL0043]